MRIGIVSGGFKPYHKGHHHMVAQAAGENDRVVLLTSPSKGRDEISGPAMARVWVEVIMPIFPFSNVDLEFTQIPVGRAFEMLEELEAGELGDNTILNLYGGAGDISSRFSENYLANKFPKSYHSGKIEKTPFVRGKDSPTASGTAAREALASRNHHAFKDELPKFLQPKAGLIMQMLL